MDQGLKRGGNGARRGKGKEGGKRGRIEDGGKGEKEKRDLLKKIIF